MTSLQTHDTLNCDVEVVQLMSPSAGSNGRSLALRVCNTFCTADPGVVEGVRTALCELRVVRDRARVVSLLRDGCDPGEHLKGARRFRLWEFTMHSLLGVAGLRRRGIRADPHHVRTRAAVASADPLEENHIRMFVAAEP